MIEDTVFHHDPIVSLPPRHVLSRRFHVVTGKGGVGRSTVSISLGLAMAAQGLKVLICEIDDREHLSEAFEKSPSRGLIHPLSDELPSLFGVNITLNEALSEYGALKLKVRALSQLLIDNPLTRALITLIPGVSDLIALAEGRAVVRLMRILSAV